MSNRSSRNENGGTAIPKPLLDALGQHMAPVAHRHDQDQCSRRGRLRNAFQRMAELLGLRLQQDLLLWRKLAECTSPQDVATAYAHFWQKAAADYWLESATMSKLLVGVTAKLFSKPKRLRLKPPTQ